MTDIWTKEKRSLVMSRINGKNTKPEISVRQLLTVMGYRFRLHDKKLPGSPDIVLRKYNTAIFVHGCFWHLHSKCKDGVMPKSRRRYWSDKLLNNKKRDLRNMRSLRRMGWKVLRLWECEIEKKQHYVKIKIQKTLSESWQKKM